MFENLKLKNPLYSKLTNFNIYPRINYFKSSENKLNFGTNKIKKINSLSKIKTRFNKILLIDSNNNEKQNHTTLLKIKPYLFNHNRPKTVSNDKNNLNPLKLVKSKNSNSLNVIFNKHEFRPINRQNISINININNNIKNNTQKFNFKQKFIKKNSSLPVISNKKIINDTEINKNSKNSMSLWKNNTEYNSISETIENTIKSKNSKRISTKIGNLKIKVQNLNSQNNRNNSTPNYCFQNNISPDQNKKVIFNLFQKNDLTSKLLGDNFIIKEKPVFNKNNENDLIHKNDNKNNYENNEDIDSKIKHWMVKEKKLKQNQFCLGKNYFYVENNNVNKEFQNYQYSNKYFSNNMDLKNGYRLQVKSMNFCDFFDLELNKFDDKLNKVNNQKRQFQFNNKNEPKKIFKPIY